MPSKPIAPNQLENKQTPHDWSSKLDKRRKFLIIVVRQIASVNPQQKTAEDGIPTGGSCSRANDQAVLQAVHQSEIRPNDLQGGRAGPETERTSRRGVPGASEEKPQSAHRWR